MSETPEKQTEKQIEKKIKIYKLAAELNLASDTIIEFLTKKGYKVKNHMSPVDEEMLNDIMVHFKKDKDIAERHQKKIAQIKEEKRKEIEIQKEPEVEIVETKEPEKTEEKIEKQPEQKIIEGEKAEPQTDIEQPETTEETTSPFYREVKLQSKRGIGLTVKGKIELKKEKPEQKQTQGKTSQPTSAEIEERKKKKKKKKKVEKSKQTTVEREDDTETGKKKKKKNRIKEVNVEEVDQAIQRTLAGMEDTSVRQRTALRKKRKKEREEQETIAREIAQQESEGKLRVTEYVTVGELANLMKKPLQEVMGKCISLGMMVSINQRLDKDTIVLLADEFGLQVEWEEEFTVQELEDTPDAPEQLQHRPPIVTVMGHVDHGKTSLLDYIRRTNVVAGESGGITQHIGAYEVKTENGKYVTFLDTPGHEAFTAMRARGAQVTDIVILVVAADDSVMPQTVEAISHAKAANVPIIIAINKVDKPDANPDKIRQQLSERGVLVEEWGGKYQSVEVSARAGKNMDTLLEKVLLEAEVLDLKANPKRMARGIVIEAKLDKGKGALATVLVQKGTLHVGEPFLAGIYSGKVKAMYDERGHRVEYAGPSTPVQILGFDGIPQAGDQFIVVESEKISREISLKRQQLKREQDFREVHLVTLDDISKQIQEGKQIHELSIIVKGDVDGSVEALADSLLKLSTSEVKIRVIHKGVGAISETDVLLAAASKAIIVGFHVRPNLNARKIAEKEKVDIRLYNIIYDAINEIKNALEGLLAPTITEEVTATVEVRQVFKVPKIGAVAGCYVTDGKITRNNKIRVLRDGIPVFEGGLASLKRFKDDVKEVERGFECGLGVENFNDIKIGDIIEAYKLVETKRKLE